MWDMPNEQERSSLSAAAAAQLDAERSRMKLTQKQVADLSGVPFGTYRRLESGERVLTITHLARLAPVFRLRPSEFLARAQQSLAQLQQPTDDDMAARRSAREAVSEDRSSLPAAAMDDPTLEDEFKSYQESP